MLVADKSQLSATDLKKFISEQQHLIQRPVDDDKNAVDLNTKETAILSLASCYLAHLMADEYSKLVKSLATNEVAGISKAKSAKLIKTLMEQFWVDGQLHTQIETCTFLINWCSKERRDILKRALEAILVTFYLTGGMFKEALVLIATLSMELKKLDDKTGMTEVSLLESKTYFHLKNIPKAKAALTSAKASANSIFCAPLLQASLDTQSGILHAEEKDFKTAYSYFFEAFDAYANLKNYASAFGALKYMLLCKIMLNSTDEVESLIKGKSDSPLMAHSNGMLEAMQEISIAYKNRSLFEFDCALKKHSSLLLTDAVVKSHLNDLYETLLEQNISRVIEPYVVIEISHIARCIGLQREIVEKKISQMILDGMLNGIIDQEKDCLEIFEPESKHVLFDNALATFSQLETATELLTAKAQKFLL